MSALVDAWLRSAIRVLRSYAVAYVYESGTALLLPMSPCQGFPTQNPVYFYMYTVPSDGYGRTIDGQRTGTV